MWRKCRSACAFICWLRIVPATHAGNDNEKCRHTGWEATHPGLVTSVSHCVLTPGQPVLTLTPEQQSNQTIHMFISVVLLGQA